MLCQICAIDPACGLLQMITAEVRVPQHHLETRPAAQPLLGVTSAGLPPRSGMGKTDTCISASRQIWFAKSTQYG
jgi:hypothetical protein